MLLGLEDIDTDIARAEAILPLPISVNWEASKKNSRGSLGSKAKNSARPMGMPSRMRFSAPIVGLERPDSTREMVEFLSPARLASSRCDSLREMRSARSLFPISTSMMPTPFHMFIHAQHSRFIERKIKWLRRSDKGLFAGQKVAPLTAAELKGFPP